MFIFNTLSVSHCKTTWGSSKRKSKDIMTRCPSVLVFFLSFGNMKMQTTDCCVSHLGLRRSTSRASRSSCRPSWRVNCPRSSASTSSCRSAARRPNPVRRPRIGQGFPVSPQSQTRWQKNERKHLHEKGRCWRGFREQPGGGWRRIWMLAATSANCLGRDFLLLYRVTLVWSQVAKIVKRSILSKALTASAGAAVVLLFHLEPEWHLLATPTSFLFEEESFENTATNVPQCLSAVQPDYTEPSANQKQREPNSASSSLFFFHWRNVASLESDTHGKRAVASCFCHSYGCDSVWSRRACYLADFS